MTVDTNTMVSITEANQNFSKVARLVDELGSVVILKNNAPRYLVIDFSKADDSAVAKDEDVLEISKRLLAQNKEAYEVLAKWKDWAKSRFWCFIRSLLNRLAEQDEEFEVDGDV